MHNKQEKGGAQFKPEFCGYHKSHFAGSPTVPECDESGIQFRVPDYYVKKIRRGNTRDLLLCTTHAGWWVQQHPFGQKTQPLFRA